MRLLQVIVRYKSQYSLVYFVEDPEGGVPIPFPSPIFIGTPFPSFQIPFPLAFFRNIPVFYITRSFVFMLSHFLKLRLVTSFENNPERCPEDSRAYKGGNLNFHFL